MEISLNSHEARVLGVLIEKAFTTPDQYPLSLNAVTNGCNQKSNRNPVIDFSEAEVRIALQGLRMKGLMGVSVPSGSRVEKYRQNGKETLKLGDKSLSVLAELLIRGPQTAGELRTRAKRMRDIPDLAAMDQCLQDLDQAGFIRTLPGGRATRYVQTLCPELHPDGPEADEPPALSEAATLAAPPPSPDRFSALEERVAELEATVERLVSELGA